jgi:hypothetical protein
MNGMLKHNVHLVITIGYTAIKPALAAGCEKDQLMNATKNSVHSYVDKLLRDWCVIINNLCGRMECKT